MVVDAAYPAFYRESNVHSQEQILRRPPAVRPARAIWVLDCCLT